MEEQNYFPYDFTELKPEEKIQVDAMYKIHNMPFVRVGPKGYILFKRYEIDAANIYNMPLRRSDVFVASYQRSGTTVTQELIWLLSNKFDYDAAAKIPLIQRYQFLELFMTFNETIKKKFIEMSLENTKNIDMDFVTKQMEQAATPATRILATATSPRFVKTHLPMSLLPPNILDTAKVVYVARDPRDVVVSSYHHSRLFKIAGFDCEFKEFWNIFHNNLFQLTPIFEHVKEAWEMRNHPNMLFLFYEELFKDLPGSIRRVAEFLGKEVTEQQMARLCDHLSIDNFKKNKSVNFEELRELGALDSNETFIRKGKTGGWRDYFNEEMTQQAERWIEDNLRDTDLRYPSMR